MDGFVNDFEPAVRRGLAARHPDDMTAWDSIVGHHLGLTHVMKTFTKSIKKRVDEEVFEVYRHGIMHGTVVNFDNVVVATKAWNLLYAVADWARATRSAATSSEPEPSLKESLEQFRRNRHHQKLSDGFTPRILDAGSENSQTIQLPLPPRPSLRHGVIDVGSTSRHTFGRHYVTVTPPDRKPSAPRTPTTRARSTTTRSLP